MLLVGLLACEFGSNNSNDAGCGIRQVIHGIKGNGNGIREKTDDRLERCEKNVCDNTDNAGANDDLVAGLIFNHNVPFLLFFNINILAKKGISHNPNHAQSFLNSWGDVGKYL